MRICQKFDNFVELDGLLFGPLQNMDKNMTKAGTIQFTDVLLSYDKIQRDTSIITEI